jgi:signal transduction histidine kinase
MTSQAATRLAWSTFGACALLLVGAAVLWSMTGSRFWYTFDAHIVLIPGFATVGALLASRRPSNRIGWLFLAVGFVSALVSFAGYYALHAIYFAPGSLPGARWMAWLLNLGWPVSWGLLGYLFLLFPDGRTPSPRWRIVGWGLAASTFAVMAAVTLSPAPLDLGLVKVPNPTGIEAFEAGLLHSAATVAAVPVILAFILSVLGSLLAPVLRRRKAGTEERRQLRWLAYVLGGSVTAGIIGFILAAAQVQPGYVGGGFGVLALAGLTIGVPAGVGVAVLKYRLYEIDAFIKKSVVVGLLAAFITSVYLGVVVGIGAVVGNRRNVFLSIVATAIIAVAFQPIRGRVRRVADRLVYGKRATPYEVLSEFSERAAGTYSTEDVLPRMVQLLAEGTGATEAHVWLRVGEELRPASSWPTNGGVPPVRIIGDDLPVFPQREHAFPVRQGGELLGAITVVTPPSDPLTPDQQKLLNDVAAQTGLILRNVRLIEELRESRRRIVTAQDERARALERNIHDGAQQQIVAMSVKLRLAEQLAARDGAKAQDLLVGLQADMKDALENLRDLARGIYPPLLADQGLPAALGAQARKSGLPVAVETDGIGRYSQEVEAAVYFCCLEALQNVAKYAHASRVLLRLSDEDDRLTFALADDGEGFDPKTTTLGTGLQGMTDRVEALGGRLEVRSEPGTGTTVTGHIPAGKSPPTLR